MDIVAVTRNMEQHKLHVMRIRNMQPSTDTSTPKSLGLKHLATRPKKQQLIDDRQQDIAKENKKLMERMTKVSNLPIIIYILLILSYHTDYDKFKTSRKTYYTSKSGV